MGAVDAEADFQTAAAILANSAQPIDWKIVASLIDGAAEMGHAGALERRALLECRGVFRNADWELALNSLARAADRGSRFAARQLLLLADDRFEPEDSTLIDTPDWSDIRSRVAMSRLASAPATGGELLSSSPIVHAIPNFATAAECQWMISVAAQRLDRATVYNVPSGVDPGRTNQSARFSFANSDLVVEMIRQRIASQLGAPLGCLEMSQALHYSIGQEFVLHCDFLDPQHMGEEIARNGQRVATLLIYLNEDFEGGETSFPRLGIKHRGKIGDALVFGNLDATGRPDPRSQHAGLPPVKGEKWVFSQWVRNRPPG